MPGFMFLLVLTWQQHAGYFNVYPRHVDEALYPSLQASNIGTLLQHIDDSFAGDFPLVPRKPTPMHQITMDCVSTVALTSIILHSVT